MSKKHHLPEHFSVELGSSAHRRRSERDHPSRRLFLGGAATMIALPWLEAFSPSNSWAATTPKRFVASYLPNGFNMPDWIPTKTGADFDLSFMLAPLAKVKSKLLVLSRLDNKNGSPPNAMGDHAGGCAALLTCHRAANADGAGVRNSISIDQVIANALQDQVRVPSLQLGLEEGPTTGNCDRPYGCVYSRVISWSGPTGPLPKITNPQVVFDRLFAGSDPGATDADRKRRKLQRASVLDTVTKEAKSLNLRLGHSDRDKVDQYLSGIRGLETKIEQESAQAGGMCGTATRPASASVDVPTLSKLINDLIVMALRCDATRVVTHMLGNAYPCRSYGFIGVDENHHDLSHWDARKLGTLENPGPFRVVNRWLMSQVADLLEKLDAVPEAGGTLLDNTIFYMSCDCSNSNNHLHTNMPVLVAGGGGFGFPTGRHLDCKDAPLGNLFTSIANAMGAPIKTFGDDGTGALGVLT